MKKITITLIIGLSLIIYASIFFQLIPRRMGEHYYYYPIFFTLALLLSAPYKKADNNKTWIIWSCIAPIFCSLAAYIVMVAIHKIANDGKLITGTPLEVLIIGFIFPYLTLKIWTISILLTLNYLIIKSTKITQFNN